MGRGLRFARRPWAEGVEVLDASTEAVLLDGQGWGMSSSRLRYREDWLDAWAQWRDIVLPKAIEHRPGARPFAMYVCGEIPERPVLVAPPLSADWPRVYIPCRDSADGSWHFRFPAPYQRPEVEHLVELGIVDDDELRRHRAWMRQRSAGGQDWRHLYPWHHGSFV